MTGITKLPLPMKLAMALFALDSLACLAVLCLTRVYGLDWFGSIAKVVWSSASTDVQVLDALSRAMAARRQ